LQSIYNLFYLKLASKLVWCLLKAPAGVEALRRLSSLGTRPNATQQSPKRGSPFVPDDALPLSWLSTAST